MFKQAVKTTINRIRRQITGNDASVSFYNDSGQLITTLTTNFLLISKKSVEQISENWLQVENSNQVLTIFETANTCVFTNYDAGIDGYIFTITHEFKLPTTFAHYQRKLLMTSQKRT